MPEFIAQLERGKLWDFNGGIHPPEMKQQSSAQPLRRLSLPDALIIPLQQHIGAQGELLVSVDEAVLKGQPLTRGSGRTLPIHASTSGLITDIDLFTTAHPSGLPEICVRLVPDGLDRWVERQQLADYLQQSPESLVELIHQAGIAGLGGAGFPTARKLNGGLSMIDVLIINGAECEPYITADDRLMREHADEIIIGCEILCHILKPRLVIIGIEDNKPEAIDAMRQALSDNERIMLRVVPTKYPSGGAKQLTKILTGREIPFGHHSADIGVLMQNVGTAFAIKRAIIDAEPLIERVVTLTGDTVTEKGNYWVRLGTPVSHLLHRGGYSLPPFTTKSSRMVIMGGPLMGFTLPHLDVPVVKITNCILAPSMQEISAPAAEQACIRCTLCVEACPAGLLPQQLYWFSKGQQHEKARDYHLFDCIECGACAYVCPSNIPLVQYYRQEKAEIRELDKENERAQQAKARFEAKQARLEREKQARQDRHKQAAVKLDQSDRDTVAAALARVQAKQQSAAATVPTGSLSIQTIGGTALPDNNPAIFASSARKSPTGQLQTAQVENESNAILLNSAGENNQSPDPRKSAVAEAIARAKAKKAALQNPAVDSSAMDSSVTIAEPTVTESVDPRKAAVAEAIARAKAKKAALAARSSSHSEE